MLEAGPLDQSLARVEQLARRLAVERHWFMRPARCSSADDAVAAMPPIPYAALSDRIREELARSATSPRPAWSSAGRTPRSPCSWCSSVLSVALLVLRSATSRVRRRTDRLPALLHTRAGRGSARCAIRAAAAAGRTAALRARAGRTLHHAAEEQVSYPGRRIALLIDASSSMLAPFPAQQLGAKAPNEAAFFTTVAAADAFIRQRKSGQFRGSHLAHRVRRRSVRDHAVHHRLRQRPAERGAHRRLDRVHALPESGHDHRARPSSGRPISSAPSTSPTLRAI